MFEQEEYFYAAISVSPANTVPVVLGPDMARVTIIDDDPRTTDPMPVPMGQFFIILYNILCEGLL